MLSASAPITLLGETGVNVPTRWWRAAGGRDSLSLSRMAFWLPESKGCIGRPSLLSSFLSLLDCKPKRSFVRLSGGLEVAKKLEVFAEKIIYRPSPPP